jgi:transposase
MVTIGVDAHKAVHQALALDDTGTLLGSWRGANTPDRWQELLRWGAQVPGPRQWGIEGAWKDGRGLAQFLLAQRERVVEVTSRWTAGGRRRARKAG